MSPHPVTLWQSYGCKEPLYSSNYLIICMSFMLRLLVFSEGVSMMHSMI